MIRRARRFVSVTAVLLVVLPSSSSAADEASAGPTADETQLDRVLERAQASAGTWQYVWLTVFGTTFAAQGVFFGVSQGSDARLGAAFGAVPPAVGFALALLNAPAALSLDADRRALDRSPPDSRLVAKRALVRRYADSESDQRNVFAHLGPLFLNASVATLTWLVADQPVPAAIQFGAGTLLSELRVLTAPRAATSAVAVGSKSAPRIAPLFAGTSLGLSISFE